jgi:hypothetical protein
MSTPLLGLALPADGTTNWGTLVNTSITALLDSAVAGTTTLTSDADVTLTTTAEASNQARQSVLLCTGSRAAIRKIIAPAQSKTYVVINNTTGGFGVTICGVGPTVGVTVPSGKTFLVAWNGSDFVTVGVATVNLTTDVTGVLPAANGGTGVNNSTRTITLGGNLVTSGAFSTTLTTTNTTSITLPTAGTLATLAGSETLTNKTINGSLNTIVSIGNSSLIASAITINGTSISLGNGATITAANPSQLIIGTGLSGGSYNGSATVTIAIDSTVATLTGSQTLTNKTLTSPTMTAPVLGTPASGNLANCTVDGTNLIGYRNAPQTSAGASAYTLVLGDAGDHVIFTGGTTATLTVPTNASVAFPIGTTILVVNDNTGNLTISGAGVTFQLAAGVTGNRTVATKGLATCLKTGTDTWYVSGAGVT